MAGLFMKLASKAGNLNKLANAATKAQGFAAKAQGLANKAQSVAGQLGIDTDSLLSAADSNSDMSMEPSIVYLPPSNTTRTSTYILCISFLALVIGVILILVSNSQCKTDPNGTPCKNNQITGIVMTVICALLILCMCYMRLSGDGTF